MLTCHWVKKPMLPGLMLNASSEGWRALKLLGRQAAMSHHKFMQLSACCVGIHRYGAGCNMQSRQIERAVGAAGGGG